MCPPPPGGDLRNRIGPIYLVMEENHVSDPLICSCIFAKKSSPYLRPNLSGHADLVAVSTGVQQVVISQKKQEKQVVSECRSNRLNVRSQQTHNYRTSVSYRRTHGRHTDIAGFSLNRQTQKLSDTPGVVWSTHCHHYGQHLKSL